MSAWEYYEQMKALARSVRGNYGITGARLLKRDLRRIYKDQGIKLDLWPRRFKSIRGAYINDDLGPTVMIVKGLPLDPTVFTMAHELKHHLVDRELGPAYCQANPRSHLIEVSAEVFAAELIYPDGEFLQWFNIQRITRANFQPEHLVQLKVETRTTLSYAGLAKRAVFFGLAPESLLIVKFKNLEYSLYGKPVYKRFR